jgi:alpha-tubulin suppressor-like RCC1 family protein
MKRIIRSVGSIVVTVTLATSPTGLRAGTFFENLQLVIDAVQLGTPTPADQVPGFGNFYSAQRGAMWPPLPLNTMYLPCWQIDESHFVYDDRNVDYAALQADADAAGLLSAPLGSPLMMMSSSLLNTAVAYGNPAYLINMAAGYDGSTATTSFGIAGGTNNVPYDILTTTNLANPVSAWTWQGIGYTSYGYVFSNQPVNQAFYMLAKPTKTTVVPWGSDYGGECDIPAGITNALMVAGGYGQSLALLSDRTVMAWGRNDYGQGSVPASVSNVTMIGAGWYHDVALLTNGTVTAWGLNWHGVYNLTEVPSGLSNVTVISAQALHSLALKSDGTVVAWGYNSWGETNVPAGLSNVVAISAGYWHSLAAKADGTVTAWGNNQYGQCTVPSGLNNVVDVAAGPFHSLALLSNGTVVAWGDGSDGETNVPSGLNNVVAIAAGGYAPDDTAYSLALKGDGTVVAWGEGAPAEPVAGLTNVIAIAPGADHALAIRTGPRTPVITLVPTDQYQLAGGNVTFNAKGVGLYGVTYHWQVNGVDIAGATNASLTVSNVQANAYYNVMVANEVGSIVSPNAGLYLVTSPVITTQTVLNSQYFLGDTPITLSITANAPGEFDGFPLSYQWQLDGTNISGQTLSNYTFSAASSGTYSVIVSNAAGVATSSWQITVFPKDAIIPWGSNTNGQLNVPSQLTNMISLAAGKAHGIVALETGSVANWGSFWTGTNFVTITSPPPLTNATAVAAGSRHDVALKANGTVVAWGMNDYGQTNVPSAATNIIAISANGQQSLALKKSGTVLQWGQTNGPVPVAVTNVTAIASGTNFHLALLTNSTLIAWGANNFGQTNIPAGLSNVVGIAAGGAHALALKVDGTVVAWGALTNVPPGLSNVMNIAAGESHSIALKNDGTIVAWGDNSFGQTNAYQGLDKVKLIAGGGGFSVATRFNPFVFYAVDVRKDLLLIYNTNSLTSSNVCAYYLAHRPMVSGANVLGIGCGSVTNETVTDEDFTNQIGAPFLSWIAANPTKKLQYVIVFPDIPTKVYPRPNVGCCLRQLSPGYPPFVHYINMGEINDMGSTNACMEYIDKLEHFGTTFCPGKLLISASTGGYVNTNYIVDALGVYFSWIAPATTNALLLSGVSPSAMLYIDGNQPDVLSNHVTQAVNVAGYFSAAGHSALGCTFAIDGRVRFSGQSGWFAMTTFESYSGIRNYLAPNYLSTYVEWYASNAFGGTNYENTPVVAVANTDECSCVPDPSALLGLWATGKNGAICCWQAGSSQSWITTLAIGDPFVKR